MKINQTCFNLVVGPDEDTTEDVTIIEINTPEPEVISTDD